MPHKIRKPLKQLPRQSQPSIASVLVPTCSTFNDPEKLYISRGEVSAFYLFCLFVQMLHRLRFSIAFTPFHLHTVPCFHLSLSLPQFSNFFRTGIVPSLCDSSEMASQEHDSGIMQWARRLLDGDPIYNPVHYGDMIQHDANDIYRGQYARGPYDTESNHVENDEIIAYTLQQEYSRLSVAENTGYSHAEEEHSQASTHADDWDSLSRRDYCSDHTYANEEADTVVPSCSSPGHLELTDECAVDGEVGWSFNQIMPVPHVPRINGEIPSIDEATSDHQRLLDRLQLYGVVEHKVQGDGNCQFRALSDQLYHSQDHHNDVRGKVVNQLKSHPEIYEGYVPMAYDDYLEKMSKSGEWGDHVTLQAAADSYGVKILVLTSFKDTCCIEILPNIQTSKRVIILSFWAEVHYNSIHPQEGTASHDYRKKKRWWIFGNKN